MMQNSYLEGIVAMRMWNIHVFVHKCIHLTISWDVPYKCKLWPYSHSMILKCLFICIYHNLIYKSIYICKVCKMVAGGCEFPKDSLTRLFHPWFPNLSPKLKEFLLHLIYHLLNLQHMFQSQKKKNNCGMQTFIKKAV